MEQVEEDEDIERGADKLISENVISTSSSSSFAGVASMAISSCAYSIMGLLVKFLAVKSFPSSQIVAVRCGLVAWLSGAELKRIHHPLLGTPELRHLVLARALVGFVALSAYFYSIQVLTLRDATILNFTMPVFTAILAAILLHERWGRFEAAGTLCSLLGVILVMQPQVISSGEKTREYLGVSMAMIGSLTGALSYIIIRVIGKRGEPPEVCVFAFAALSAPLALVGMMFQGVKLPTPIDSLQLIGVGLSAYAAQIFLTRGLQLEKAAKATSIQYVKVLCSYVLGVVFLGEKPSLYGALGAVFIALSAAFVSTRNEQKHHPK